MFEKFSVVDGDFTGFIYTVKLRGLRTHTHTHTEREREREREREKQTDTQTRRQTFSYV